MSKEEIIENVLLLYSCKPTEMLVSSLYSDDSVFEDPISCANA